MSVATLLVFLPENAFLTMRRVLERGKMATHLLKDQRQWAEWNFVFVSILVSVDALISLTGSLAQPSFSIFWKIVSIELLDRIRGEKGGQRYLLNSSPQLK